MSPRKAPSTKKRILIIGPSNIGDGILIAEVVSRLRAAFPEAHLALMVGNRALALFEGDGRIQTLLDADRHEALFPRIRLAVDLWRYQPHILVDLRHTLFPLLLKPQFFWRYLRQPPKRLRHMRERHLWKMRLQVPGIDKLNPEKPTPALWISPADVAAIETLCRRWGIEPATRFAVICPGARSHIKRWTAGGFAQLADRLVKESKLQVIFSGEPEEKGVIEEIRQQMAQKALTTVGLTTIRQLAVLMSRAVIVVTNDSASLHLASAVGAPSVAIFGPTDASKYGPTAPKNRVVRRQLFCSPCERALCGFSHECMRFIPAEQVYAAAGELLK